MSRDCREDVAMNKELKDKVILYAKEQKLLKKRDDLFKKIKDNIENNSQVADVLMDFIYGLNIDRVSINGPRCNEAEIRFCGEYLNKEHSSYDCLKMLHNKFISNPVLLIRFINAIKENGEQVDKLMLEYAPYLLGAK